MYLHWVDAKNMKSKYSIVYYCATTGLNFLPIIGLRLFANISQIFQSLLPWKIDSKLIDLVSNAI